MLPFQTISKKTVYSNLLNPADLPAITDAAGKVTFKNTKPREGEKVLFKGCDFRDAETFVKLEKRKGRILYNGRPYQYAIETEKEGA